MATSLDKPWMTMKDKDDPRIFPNSGPRSVLLVDDEVVLARSLGRVLNEAGYQVVEAHNVAEAKLAIASHSFDIILSDISMPGESGLELLAAVRREGLSAPVLLMTGVPNVDTAAKAVERGALRYLMKPFGIEELIAAVKQAVLQHDVADLQRQGITLVAEARKEREHRSALAGRFDRALAAMQMVFQPIVHPRTQTVFGFEALLRSGEPTLAAPDEILTAAEQLDRLHDLGRAVRRSVAEVVPSAPCPNVFVNLHSQDLLDDELFSPGSPLSRVAERVVLEITERASMDLSDAARRVRALRQLGFRIAIDDLGAGYAGLSSAVELRPDIVKFDMSLVRGIEVDVARWELMASMVKAFHEMRVTTIGEGVETTAERDALLEVGCDALQGFLFAKPGPPFPTVRWS